MTSVTLTGTACVPLAGAQAKMELQPTAQVDD